MSTRSGGVRGSLGASAGAAQQAAQAQKRAAEAAARRAVEAQKRAAAQQAKQSQKPVDTFQPKGASASAGMSAQVSASTAAQQTEKPITLGAQAGASVQPADRFRDVFEKSNPIKAALLTGDEYSDTMGRRDADGNIVPQGDYARQIEERERTELIRNSDPIVKSADSLQVGEKMVVTDKTGVNATVKAAKIGLEGGGGTTLERTGDTTWKLTDATEGGAKVGVGSKTMPVEGEVAASGESVSEYQFTSQADARRGADLVRNGPRSEEDRQWLDAHRTSSEYAAKVSTGGNVNFPDPKGVVATNVEAKGEARQSIKYNYKTKDDGTVETDANGKPVVDSIEYITKTTGTLTGKGTVSVPGVAKVDTGDVATGQVEIEQKRVVKVPAGVDPAAVERDPSLGQDVSQNAHEVTIKVTGETRIGGLEEGKSVVREYETKVRLQQPENQPQKPTVETVSRSYEKNGQVYNGGVDLGPIPVGVTYQGERTRSTKPEETKIESLSSS